MSFANTIKLIFQVIIPKFNQARTDYLRELNPHTPKASDEIHPPVLKKLDNIMVRLLSLGGFR